MSFISPAGWAEVCNRAISRQAWFCSRGWRLCPQSRPQTADVPRPVSPQQSKNLAARWTKCSPGPCVCFVNLFCFLIWNKKTREAAPSKEIFCNLRGLLLKLISVMYVGNSVQGIREAGLQLYSVADGCFGSWGTAELCPCMAALQPTARQLWACTLQSDAVFVCLSELPKWSGRPWSTRLLTARWYSPSTGWRPC